jgi:hypothetical protein
MDAIQRWPIIPSMSCYALLASIIIIIISVASLLCISADKFIVHVYGIHLFPLHSRESDKRVLHTYINVIQIVFAFMLSQV